MVSLFRGLNLGILGGGQLGKLLLAEAQRFGVRALVLDPSKDCPSASVCAEFVEGDFADEASVLGFGSRVSVLTAEIEHVNTKALERLEGQGLRVFPSSELISLVQDKGLQKAFYLRHGLPQADYRVFEGKGALLEAVRTNDIPIPFVQKGRFLGYDGKGVRVVRGEEDLGNLLEGPCLVEREVAIQKELSVIVVRSESGDVRSYEPVEMVFNAERHLLEHLLCPAGVPKATAEEAQGIAIELARKWRVVGLLAVEFFVDEGGSLFVNEVAPRPHNSGHHTIEGCCTSQYEQHLRAMLGFPLGSSKTRSPSVLFNLLGRSEGNPEEWLLRLREIARIDGASIYWYGKQERPFRKMGHVTLVGGGDLKQRAGRLASILGLGLGTREGL